MTSAPAHRILVLMLRLMGALSLIAVTAVFMPHSLMNWFHESLGMGELPSLPIVKYLSRSLSGFYLFFGAIVLYLARDVDRYFDLICFWARCGLGFAAISLYIDVSSKLPWWWIVAEVGFLFSFFGTVLYLLKQIRPQR